jgi:hypothetical protein
VENSTFFNELKGWPWTIWRRLNPAFKVLTAILTLVSLPVNPFNWLALAIAGYVAVAIGDVASALIVGFFGLMIWLLIEAIAIFVVWAFLTYLVTLLVGVIAILVGRDPESILFR